jgi:hypothetical protein
MRQRSDSMVQRMRAAVANCASVMHRHKTEEVENAASAANSPAALHRPHVSPKKQQTRYQPGLPASRPASVAQAARLK